MANSRTSAVGQLVSPVVGQQQQQVLRDTYRLLSMTLLFSAAVAAISMQMTFPYLGLWTLLPYFFLLFMVERNRHKPSGVIWTFVLTGWLGLTAGPILSYYVELNGYGPVLNAVGATGLTFLSMSALGRAAPRLMSGMYGAICVAMLVVFVIGLLNILVFGMAIDHILISGAFAVLAALMISATTAYIIKGGETSYISATVTLYVMIWNLFMFFLQFFNRR